MRIAICLYGHKSTNTQQLKNELRQKLHPSINFFESYVEADAAHTDVFLSLHRSAFSKRSYEITSRHEFDVCIAVNVQKPEEIEHLKLVTNLEYEKIYYVRGAYNSTYYVTSVNPDIFYADSITFDRACEYYLNLCNIHVHVLRGYGYVHFGHPETFYYHLKSLMFKTECVNYEDSSLFKRST